MTTCYFLMAILLPLLLLLLSGQVYAQTATPSNDLDSAERDLLSIQLTPTVANETEPDYVDLVEDDLGGTSYALRAKAPPCLVMKKGWLTTGLRTPGCRRTADVRKQFRWLCWYYASFTNSCTRWTKTIYFNCCDRKNGLFRPRSVPQWLLWARGPNMSPSWWQCSCALKVTVPPGQTYTMQYLAYGSANVTASSNPRLTPWDTFTTAAEFWPAAK